MFCVAKIYKKVRTANKKRKKFTKNNECNNAYCPKIVPDFNTSADGEIERK